MSIKLRLLLFGVSLKLKFRLALIKLGSGVHRQALKLRSCLFWKLKYQLRLLDDSSRSEGFDPTFDKIVLLAAIRPAMPTGSTRLDDWLIDYGAVLGQQYVGELRRNYRR